MPRAMKGVFREEAWATPLLATAIATLCVLLLYTVTRFYIWLKPTNREGTLPWLQVPLLMGFMFMTGTSIVSAVPMSVSACRFLFLGPGIGYTLIMAGLLSRVVQLLIRGHVILQWLLLFFAILNQFIISISYLYITQQCRLDINDQLFVLLYPGLLIGVVLLLVYRTARKSNSSWKSRQAVYIGLAATFSGAIAGCWIGAAAMLSDDLLPSCLGFGCLSTAIIVSMIALVPKSTAPDDPKEQMEYPVRQSRDSDSEMGGTSDYSTLEKPSRPRKTGGRGSKKTVPTEPEIIIVPITPGGGVPLPDIAMKAIKAHSSGQQHLHHLNHHHHLGKHLRKSRHHHHRHHHHHHQPRLHRAANKIHSQPPELRKSRRENRSSAMKISQQEQQQPAHRTPYNHRGWLY